MQIDQCYIVIDEVLVLLDLQIVAQSVGVVLLIVKQIGRVYQNRLSIWTFLILEEAEISGQQILLSSLLILCLFAFILVNILFEKLGVSEIERKKDFFVVWR